MTFREKLKALLDEKQWSAVDLSKKAKIPYSTIKAYLALGESKRRPSYDMVVKLCNAFGVSVEVFRDCTDLKKT